MITSTAMEGTPTVSTFTPRVAERAVVFDVRNVAATEAASSWLSMISLTSTRMLAAVTFKVASSSPGNAMRMLARNVERSKSTASPEITKAVETTAR